MELQDGEILGCLGFLLGWGIGGFLVVGAITADTVSALIGGGVVIGVWLVIAGFGMLSDYLNDRATGASDG